MRSTLPTRRNCSWPHKMKSLVRPELHTALVGSSQAPTAAVHNFEPLAIRSESSTYKSGNAVQKNGVPPLKPPVSHKREDASQTA